MIKDIKLQKRREAAKKKAELQKKKTNNEDYVIQNGDIVFTTGEYVGSTMTELWNRGPIQRDYVARQVGSDLRGEVRNLFLQLLCR